MTYWYIYFKTRRLTKLSGHPKPKE